MFVFVGFMSTKIDVVCSLDCVGDRVMSTSVGLENLSPRGLRASTVTKNVSEDPRISRVGDDELIIENSVPKQIPSCTTREIASEDPRASKIWMMN